MRRNFCRKRREVRCFCPERGSILPSWTKTLARRCGKFHRGGCFYNEGEGKRLCERGEETPKFTKTGGIARRRYRKKGEKKNTFSVMVKMRSLLISMESAFIDRKKGGRGSCFVGGAGGVFSLWMCGRKLPLEPGEKKKVTKEKKGKTIH